MRISDWSSDVCSSDLNPSTLLQFLPKRMGEFLAYRDNISVNLLERHSYDIPRLVAEAEADIGIYHARHPALGVRSYHFANDRVGLVVQVGHPLEWKSVVRGKGVAVRDVHGGWWF